MLGQKTIKTLTAVYLENTTQMKKLHCRADVSSTEDSGAGDLAQPHKRLPCKRTVVSSIPVPIKKRTPEDSCSCSAD